VRKPRLEELDCLKADSEIDWVTLAVQCKVRGLHDLASAAYARRGSDFTRRIGNGEAEGKGGVQPIRMERCSIIHAIRDEAWRYWVDQLRRGDRDRKTVLHYLKLIDPERAITRDLELTLAPRKSRPGSVESLIDDLIDYEGEDWLLLTERGRLIRIAEHGFDAIPALIEHSTDRRITLLGSSSPRGLWTVGELCHRLLDELLSDLDTDLRDPTGALRTYGRAQTVGEERWFVDHAIRTVSDPARPAARKAVVLVNYTMLRVIAAKYPHHLAPMYQTILYKVAPVLGNRRHDLLTLPWIIRDSRLPRDKKIALLVEGTKHPRYGASFPALEVLSEVDMPTFHRMLLSTLRSYPNLPDPQLAKGFGGGGFREQCLVGVVSCTRDPAIWDEFFAVAQRISLPQRLKIIKELRHDLESRATKADRIRFLLRFANVKDAREAATAVLSEIIGLDAAKKAMKKSKP
jgi:hypothetical protein